MSVTQERRVTLALHQRTVDRLDSLKLRTEAGSYGEVVRQALRVYEIWLNEHATPEELAALDG